MMGPGTWNLRTRALRSSFHLPHHRETSLFHTIKRPLIPTCGWAVDCWMVGSQLLAGHKFRDYTLVRSIWAVIRESVLSAVCVCVSAYRLWIFIRFFSDSSWATLFTKWNGLLPAFYAKTGHNQTGFPVSASLPMHSNPLATWRGRLYSPTPAPDSTAHTYIII